jgi:uncharacterized protein YdeI (YjbR/CyaY-like superfamily)
MKISRNITPATRAAWRHWLKINHRVATEVWIIFYKKHAKKSGIRYADAVEEAICFGWIDGIVRRLDDDTYEQRFTPRRPGSRWSELNRRRAKKMIADGRVTEVGMARYRTGLKQPKSGMSQLPNQRLVIPGHLRLKLKETQDAWENFTKLPNGYKRMAIRWITAAKRDETRTRRVEEFVRSTAAGGRIGLK